MSDQSGRAYEIVLQSSIDKIEPHMWDGLCPGDDPFITHRFLHTMEASGSASPETGWQPIHLTLIDSRSGELKAIVPLYLKGHSWGEYVFDHSWAQAYERVGGSYYPKLQASVPFTPVPGSRLLIGDADSEQSINPGSVGEALKQAAAHLNISSVHVTFCSKKEADALAEVGFLHRTGMQYHWHNRNYGDFDSFLGELRSNKRKMIKRERREVQDAGIHFEVLSGSDLSGSDLEAFYPFYLRTVDKRWGGAYLTSAFFRMLGKLMPERIVLVRAQRQGKTVAAALNLRSQDTLYGRIWGCLDDFKFLHFETCYYQAIDYAIQHNISKVEAGAQGQHKLQRGYEPVTTHSAHWIVDRSLRDPVRNFLKQEKRHMALEREALRELLPFKRGD